MSENLCKWCGNDENSSYICVKCMQAWIDGFEEKMTECIEKLEAEYKKRFR